MTTLNATLRDVDDRSLLNAAQRLATEERRATAALLRALMEIDKRRLYLGEGCASMFTYCTQVLHLSEGAAYNRIEAARAARAYPVILELLEQSAVSLTAIRLLAPHLTNDNHPTVLAAARHKSRREIDELIVALKPKPDAPALVRKLPQVRPLALAPLSDVTSAETARPAVTAASEAPTPVRIEPTRTTTPLAPERYRIQLTVSRETHDKFRRAQSLLRHAVPSGDAAEIFDRAITLLVEKVERQKAALVARPRSTHKSDSAARHIAAAVRREVWKRDDGRCAFIGAHGRCGETAFLEFHHVHPFAAAGRATVDNIALRCRAHNAFEASLFFGGGADVVRESPSPTLGR